MQHRQESTPPVLAPPENARDDAATAETIYLGQAADEPPRAPLPAESASHLPTLAMGEGELSEFIDEDPTKLGHFVILSRLGAGGMGVVFSAYDEELDRKVAIKLLARAPRGETIGHARILREAQAMARLSHPNVAQVYEVGRHDDRVFVAMEFIKGVTLRDWLARSRRPWREIVKMFVQAGRGLAAAHAAELVHRDFKPNTELA